jgi:hypothetical protein
VVLLGCAVVASAAIFIILEMYGPFNGILRISPPPTIHDDLNQKATDGNKRPPRCQLPNKVIRPVILVFAAGILQR